jgi:hypothetical protein
MTPNPEPDHEAHLKMLNTAIEEARQGLAEGGIPIGAALFDRDGKVLAGCKRTTPPSTAKPTPSAKPAASAATATRSWSPR